MRLDAFDWTRFGLFYSAFDFPEFFQVWQPFEVFEAEGFEKLGCGAIDDRPTGGFLAARYLDEPALQQRFQHSARIDPTKLLDLGAGDGLSIRDDRDRL